jgi:DNA-binding protein HU-beta
MNKSELIDIVAREAGISKMAADKAMRCFEKTVTGALSKGEDVRMIGFGRFFAKKRAARQCRNPQTGKKMQIPARQAVCFRAGKRLKEAIE